MNQKGAADWFLGGRCDSQPLFSLWILSVHLNSGLSEHRVFVFPYLGPQAHRPRDWLVANLCEIGNVGHKEGVASKVSLIALLFTSSDEVAHSFMKHGDVSADTCIYSPSDGGTLTENVRLQSKSCLTTAIIKMCSFYFESQHCLLLCCRSLWVFADMFMRTVQTADNHS